MIAGRIQAICRPNCRGTRLSKQRSWPIEIVWTPSNQWEKRGYGQGWATGMKACADCELQWSQTREGESLSSHWHCPCCLRVYWEAYSFSPSRIFCVHLFLHSLSYYLVWACYAYSPCMQWKQMGASNKRFNPLILGTSLWVNVTSQVSLFISSRESTWLDVLP